MPAITGAPIHARYPSEVVNEISAGLAIATLYAFLAEK